MGIINRYIGALLLWGWFIAPAMAVESYCFRVYLKDKEETEYLLENPEEFLSRESIQRRIARNAPVTTADIPVSQVYLDTLQVLGAEPMVSSKWMNTVVVASADSLLADRISELGMVDSVKWIWKGKRDDYERTRTDSCGLFPDEVPLKSAYGYAEKQIKMHNGIKLNQAGFRGDGMRIAVIDAGFMNVDRISAFDSLKLIGTHNVLFPGETVFDGDDHGTKVLSCLAANIPGVMVGTAPEASYLLIQSEDVRSEYPIEEDYWVAAVEYADSVGVDVITSSLGYFSFDSEDLSYTHDDLDGKTAFISQAAAVVAEKGILLFSSAGNEGSSCWEKITFPSDVPTLMTVGAVTGDKKKSSFSSVGLTADNRIKPDVAAMGTASCVIDQNGNIRYANGTSFSTPILAGLGVCLWQALPQLSNQEIIDLIKQASSQYKRPDVELGYGIPDIYKAYKNGLKYVSSGK